EYVIELGPEGGDEGGRVIAQGTPEEVARVKESYTGQYLSQVFSPKSEVQSPKSEVQSPKSKGQRAKGKGQSPEARFSPTLTVAEPKVDYHPHTNGNAISVVGAKEHNLQNISLEIPRDEMVVVTGLSGSGKSTLVFDIVYAEGQRR